MIIKKKIIGIFVCLMFVGTVLPVYGDNLEKTSDYIPGIGMTIESGGFYPQTIFGCHGEVYCSEGYNNITLNVSFTVSSYSLQGEYLGESSRSFESTFHPKMSASPYILPEYYGETFTWVNAKLDVTNVTNSEQTDSVTAIGIGIGKLIYFSIILFWINYFFKLLT